LYFYHNYPSYCAGPLDAPKNLTVLSVTGSKSAILSWEPVSPESVRGNFKGYKVNLYTDILNSFYILIFEFIIM